MENVMAIKWYLDYCFACHCHKMVVILLFNFALIKTNLVKNIHSHKIVL